MIAARPAALLAALAVLAAAPGCNGRRTAESWNPDPRPPPDLPPAQQVRPPSASTHPRILFTPERVERLRAAARSGTDLWKKLEGRCEIFLDSEQSGGYLGLQWGEAIGNLTTCWYATGEERYRDRAVFYLRALLHDQRKVGDGKGGEKIVRGNSGYPIRAFGLYAALAYDWLHDAPGMDELRPIILDRLDAWLGWYMEEGYLNDSPYSNYFWGYFATLAIAALATHGEHDGSELWMQKTRELLDKKVVPGFQANLKGGEWAEGWQYGQLVAMEVALLVDAFHTATGADYAPAFSWLGEIVDAQLHRTHPHRGSWYGNGTQHQRPPPPDGSALASALLVLDRTDPARAAQARFILRRMFPPLPKDRFWFAILADRPDAPDQDPRRAERIAYHLSGPGQTFMRSSWQEDAVWVSFQAGPRVAVDHQQNDQGHFEIWRGGDALLSDFATQEGYATINHNSILIDDGGDVLNYTPNHGVWNRRSKTLAWHDAGPSVVVVGDLADAFTPKCVERGCNDRAVKRWTRTLVYLRPDVVVTDDAIDLAKGSYGATWVAHSKARPQGRGAHVFTQVGSSRLDAVALAPKGAAIRTVAEPTPSEDHIYRANRPDGEVWRLEVDTPRGEPTRRIQTWMRAAPAGAAPARVTAVRGKGLAGGVGQVGQVQTAVLFADSHAGGEVELPAGPVRALVVGLEPGAMVTALTKRTGRGCTIAIKAGQGGAARTDPAGAVMIDLAGCKR